MKIILERNRRLKLLPLLNYIPESEDVDDFKTSTPDALSFEHFLPWIWEIMIAYEVKGESEKVSSRPEGSDGIRYSKAYYTKKFK